MSDLEEIIEYALSKADKKAPFFVDTVAKNIQKNTKDKVFTSLSPIDEVRVFDDIEEFVGAGEINRALKSLYDLLDSLRENYNTVYSFQMEGFSYEDNKYIVNIKKMINGLLIIKASRLFDDGDTGTANEIKNMQIAYINHWRYPTYEKDLEEWMIPEKKWNTILDRENITTQDDVPMRIEPIEPVPGTEKKDFINGQLGTSGEFSRLKRWIAENDRLLQDCDIFIMNGKLEDAMHLCLERLWFFLGTNNTEVYDVLTIVNAPYFPAWEREIHVILENNFIWDEYIIQKIYHIMDHPRLPGTIRNILSSALFRWGAF